MSRIHRERRAEELISELENRISKLKDEMRNYISDKEHAESKIKDLEEEIVKLEDEIQIYNDAISY